MMSHSMRAISAHTGALRPEVTTRRPYVRRLGLAVEELGYVPGMTAEDFIAEMNASVVVDRPYDDSQFACGCTIDDGCECDERARAHEAI